MARARPPSMLRARGCAHPLALHAIRAIAGASIGCAASIALVSACGGDDSNHAESTCNGGEALTVCATSNVIHGVDVSTYQGTVDWTKAKAGGIDFAFARISDGTKSPDVKFAANWSGMKQAGIVRGAYQFFRPAQDPAAQADLALNALGNGGVIPPGDLPLVMDIEVTDNVPVATIRTNMQTWLDRIEQATGRAPILYTAPFMSATIGNGFAKYVLWVANYQVTCPTMPANWTAWSFWQTSGSGTAPGVTGAVDLDDFNGSLADLLVFANGPLKDAGLDGSHDAAPADATPLADSAPPSPIGRLDSGSAVAGDASPCR